MSTVSDRGSGTIRYPLPEGERWTEDAAAGLVGKPVTRDGVTMGTVTAVRLGADGWVELDIEVTNDDWDAAPLGSSLVTSLSTGKQWIEPPAPPIEPTRWHEVER